MTNIPPMDFSELEQWLKDTASREGLENPQQLLALMLLAQCQAISQQQHMQFVITLGMIQELLGLEMGGGDT